MFSARILWAVKILLVLHKASEAGTPLMKGRELQAACVGPDTDTYMYRRTLRELAAKTDYLICVFQSGRTFYQWNPNHRPTLHDLIRRLDGGMHEVSHTFWTYENTRTMQPLQKVCKEYDNLIQTYLSEDIHRRIGITSPVQAKPVPVAAGNAPGHRGDRNRLALAPSRQRTKTHSWKNKQPPTIFILSLPAIAAPALAVAVACHMYRTRQITRITDSQRDHRYREISNH